MQSKQELEENIFTKLTLPPGLPLPSIPNLRALVVNFNNPSYLERVSDELKEISLQWWGANRPHSLCRQDKGFKGQYPLSCSLEQFFGYLEDMKLLGVKIIGRRGSIGKALLNFLLIRGWKGERLEGNLDIKSGNKKIGEIAYSIQIVNISNPHIAEKPEFSQRQTQNNLSLHQTEVDKKFPKSISVIEEKPSQLSEIQTKNRKSIKKISDQNNLFVHPLSNKNQNTNFFLEDNFNNENMKEKRKSWNYDAQIVRLTEDYNVLFNKISSSYLNFQGGNVIEIQVAKIQIEQKKIAQIQLTVPLIGGSSNYYRIFPGAIIKISLQKQKSQHQLMNYLQECQILLKYEGKLQGNIRLTKLLATAGDYQRVPLFDNSKTKQKKKQKGNCLLRAIPVQQQQAKQIIQQNYKPLQKQQDKIQSDIQVEKKQKGQYILFNLKKYHSIDSPLRTFNIFVRIICKENEICQSQTLWNSTLPCAFDQRLTGKTTSNILEIQVYERKQEIICLGSGYIQLNSPLGIALQVPIVSKYKKGKTVGYISLDYFKNGLQGITKMSQVLLKNKTTEIPAPVQTEVHRQIQLNEETPLQASKNHQMQPSLDNQQEKKQSIMEQKNTIPKYIKQTRKRSTLQIYNSMFTYFHSHTRIPERLLETQFLKISEFLAQIQGVLNGVITGNELNQILPNHIVSKGDEEKVYFMDCNSLLQSYQAFLTYFEEIAAQKDELLDSFLKILQQSNLSINDLEYSLGTQRKIWKKINSILQYRKGSDINIVEKLKQYYNQQNDFTQVSARQLCDSLRKFEVFQTTLGQKIDHKLLTERVYTNTIMILQELQTDINFYSHRQLINCLQREQIILSYWEMQNLQMYLNALPKNKIKVQRQTQKNRHIQAIQQKQTITKSPTFGHLHQAEQTKRTVALQPDMKDSLAIKMQELAISPINYVSNNSQPARQAKVFFTNLVQRPIQLIIDGVFLKFGIFEQSHIPSQQREDISKQKEGKLQDSNQNQQIKNYKSSDPSQNDNEEWVCQVKEGVQLKFSYQIQIQLQGIGHVLLECLHGQWSAIVDEQGEYLGGILIQ